MNEATARILEFIGRIRPGYARMLRWEIGRMPEEGQLDRVTQALAVIRPTEGKAPETPGPPKAFFDELSAATDELNRATQRLKSELEK
jgi:hypothetical protein